MVSTEPTTEAGRVLLGEANRRLPRREWVMVENLAACIVAIENEAVVARPTFDTEMERLASQNASLREQVDDLTEKRTILRRQLKEADRRLSQRDSVDL